MSSLEELVKEFRNRGTTARNAKLKFRAEFARGVREKDHDAYLALLEEYKTRTKAAYPPDFRQLLGQIDAASSSAIDTAIAFLVADPYFNNSGYINAALIRRLKRAALTPKNRKELSEVIIDRIHGPDRHELSHFGRLAAALRLPELDAMVLDLTKHSNAGVARRAGWILTRIKSRGQLNSSPKTAGKP